MLNPLGKPLVCVVCHQTSNSLVVNNDEYTCTSCWDSTAQLKRPERRDRRSDFDEIRIRTLPHFKDSPTGSEWRTTVQFEALNKGRTRFVRGFSTFHKLAIHLPLLFLDCPSDIHMSKAPDVDDLCDQDGCPEPFTRTYRVKGEKCDECNTDTDLYKFNDDPILRKYCERHAKRGEGYYNDMDANLEELDPKLPSPTIRNEDKPSDYIQIVDSDDE